MKHSDVRSLCIRYGLLLVIGITNILLGDNGLFYKIFTPLTINPVYYFFQTFYEGVRFFGEHTIFIKGYYTNIIPACVAGSAYYLLLILNLTTPMPLRKRAFCIIYTFALLLVLNIARIVIFGILLTKGYQYFDLTHIATWYLGSTVLVAAIWFSAIFIFKIREAPVITDITAVMKDIKQ